jgi:hypothetical protein
VTSAWTKFSGPGTVTFGNAANAVTTAAFDQAWHHVAADRERFASDGVCEVTITVNPAIVTPTNQPPACRRADRMQASPARR